MRLILENLIRKIRNRRKPGAAGARVRYKFNTPGFSNFHLLPYKSKRPPLNIFRPHWTGSFRPQTRIQRLAR
ncbi:MAG: hypothetical protein IPM52_12930 [Bacteroidetes bacterium]|nr:hypothetical protein [Bacteroidota bacterium]